MGIDFFKVEDALKEAYMRGETRFNAYTVAFWSNQSDILAVNNYLLSKNGNVLEARIEFLCDENNHPTGSIKFGEKIPPSITCHICQNEFIPSLEFSNIIFNFSNPLSRSSTKQEKKKLQLVT
ncbi:hypothetical protein ACIQYG_22000 [Peribacillus sp. NPDC096622]|uniref:hypothetical protein n=1 Tax=Peribacillus sp. NPDC096622 TaxID=3364396 RepID=UPI0037F11D80